MIARIFGSGNPSTELRLTARLLDLLDDLRVAECVIAQQRAALDAARQRLDALAPLEAAVGHIAVAGVDDNGETVTFTVSGEAMQVVLAAVLAARRGVGR